MRGITTLRPRSTAHMIRDNRLIECMNCDKIHPATKDTDGELVPDRDRPAQCSKCGGDDFTAVVLDVDSPRHDGL